MGYTRIWGESKDSLVPIAKRPGYERNSQLSSYTYQSTAVHSLCSLSPTACSLGAAVGVEDININVPGTIQLLPDLHVTVHVRSKIQIKSNGRICRECCDRNTFSSFNFGSVMYLCQTQASIITKFWKQGCPCSVQTASSLVFVLYT